MPSILDHRPLKEPSRLFESMVVVGLHPNCDIQALQKQYFGRKSEGSGKFRSAFSGQHQSRVEPNLEPQFFIFRSYLFILLKNSCHLSIRIFFHSAFLEVWRFMLLKKLLQ
ncbi:uncharacterized protein LOC114302459 isoform X2 [Camellia sinensis]|uniref:uncharacterized protein LOC114302459 isoform X2 n=1 Tax=Camellia sinensis TaxID=4442 RepID=UPI001035BEFB|nr:uncharacterized protein LOC114302459 isoform X2 [Camellia sinensis]